MAETTLDSLQIEIEASSDKATKRIDQLTAALKRLQAATTGKFENPVKQLEGVEEQSAAQKKVAQKKQAFSAATGQIKSKIATKDIFPGTDEISKAIDSARQKYDELVRYAEENKGKITRDAASQVLRQIQTEKEELNRIFEGIEGGIGQKPKNATELYYAADKLAEVEERFNQIWNNPIPQIIDTKSIQAATNSAAEFQKTLENTSLGTADKFLEANSQMDILQRKAESLKSALDQALGEGDQEKADQLAEQYRKVTSQIEKLGQESNKTAKDVNKLKGEFRKATSPISKFTQTLGRVAYYRAIRSAIKAVTDGIKTGMDNLYEYSRITGTEFKPAMDSLATSSLYLKNSLGALIGPIVQSLAPAVEYLTDRFVDLINVFNQFISALSGKDVYTAAKKHAVEYKEATDAAAKSTKKFLLGIDELNIMDSPSGGAGSASQDFGDMFEEKPIDNTIKGWADALKPLLDDVGLIAAGIAGWQLTKGFLGDLENTSTLMKGLKAAAVLTVQFILSKWTMDNLLNSKKIGDQIKWGIGNVLTQGLAGYAAYKILKGKGILLSAAVGLVANLYSISYGIREGGLSTNKDPKVWIFGAISTALAGIGGGIALKKMGWTTFGDGFKISVSIGAFLTLSTIAFSEVSAGNWKVNGVETVLSGIGATAAAALGGWKLAGSLFGSALAGAGLGVGLFLGAGLYVSAIAIGVAENAKADYESTEFHKKMQRYADNAAKSIEVSKQIKVNIETRYTEFSKISSQYTEYMDILDRIFELDAIPEKSASELSLMSEYISIINGLGIDNLSITLDQQTGKINEEKDALYGVIKALQEKAKKEALYDLTVQAYKDQASAAFELAKQQSELKEVENEIARLTKERNAAYDRAEEVTLSYAGGVVRTSKELADLGWQLKDAQEKQGALNDSVREAEEALEKATKDTKFYEDELKNLGNESHTIGENISLGIVKGIENAKQKVSEAMANTVRGAITAGKKVAQIASPSKVFRDEVGYFMGAGVAVGIDNSASLVEQSVSDLINTAEESFSSATFDPFVFSIEADTSGVEKAIEKVYDGITYNPTLDYKSLMNEAKTKGNWDEYIKLEKARNAKIDGESLNYEKSYNYAYISDDFLSFLDNPYKNYKRDYDYSGYSYGYKDYSGIDYDKLNDVLAKNAEIIVASISQENQTRATTMTTTISEDAEEYSNNIVNAVMAIGQQIVQAVNSKETSFTMDGKQLARVMQEYNAQAVSNRGSSLVRVGG